MTRSTLKVISTLPQVRYTDFDSNCEFVKYVFLFGNCHFIYVWSIPTWTNSFQLQVILLPCQLQLSSISLFSHDRGPKSSVWFMRRLNNPTVGCSEDDQDQGLTKATAMFFYESKFTALKVSIALDVQRCVSYSNVKALKYKLSHVPTAPCSLWRIDPIPFCSCVKSLFMGPLLSVYCTIWWNSAVTPLTSHLWLAVFSHVEK